VDLFLSTPSEIKSSIPFSSPPPTWAGEDIPPPYGDPPSDEPPLRSLPSLPKVHPNPRTFLSGWSSILAPFSQCLYRCVPLHPTPFVVCVSFFCSISIPHGYYRVRLTLRCLNDEKFLLPPVLQCEPTQIGGCLMHFFQIAFDLVPRRK